MTLLDRPARYAVVADLPDIDAYAPDVRPARRRRDALRIYAERRRTLTPTKTGFRVRLIDQRTGQVVG